MYKCYIYICCMYIYIYVLHIYVYICYIHVIYMLYIMLYINMYIMLYVYIYYNTHTYIYITMYIYIYIIIYIQCSPRTSPRRHTQWLLHSACIELTPSFKQLLGCVGTAQPDPWELSRVTQVSRMSFQWVLEININ